MVKAYPTDINGEKSGPSKSFSDEHWSKLSTMKGVRWIQVSDEKPKEVLELMPKASPKKFAERIDEVSKQTKEKTKKTK